MIKFAILILLLLAGCTLTPKTNAPVAIYDFGLQPSTGHSSSPPFNTSMLVADVTAPIWLDNQAIQYRLAYHDPARSYAYANSRWAASPAKMLTRRIKDHLANHSRRGIIGNHDGLKADYALHIELEEFTQVFDHPDESRVILRLRASLVERSRRQLLAQQQFTSEQTTPTADAAGAVAALIAASDMVSDDLLKWLRDHLAEKHGGKNNDVSHVSLARCCDNIHHFLTL